MVSPAASVCDHCLPGVLMHCLFLGLLEEEVCGGNWQGQREAFVQNWGSQKVLMKLTNDAAEWFKCIMSVGLEM
jgi:hypothetical protein